MKVYEPTGMFRVIQIKKPLFGIGGKIWFTTTMNGDFQLHAGKFLPNRNELHVWKSRNIHPKITLVPDGMSYHRRNPVLDEQLWKRVVRVPFLQ